MAVADTLSFVRAAEQMAITQPAITHQIHSLESELNTKLFHRTTRSVNITPSGEALLMDAENMVLIANRIKKRYETSYHSEMKPFSIGCYGFNYIFFLPEILRSMVALYPDMHPALHIVPFKHLYRLLDEESVSVVLAFRENNTMKQPAIYKELGKVPLVAVCPKNASVANQLNCTWETFIHEKLILLHPNKCPSALLQLQHDLLETHSPDGIYFCDTPDVALTFVKAGLGVTFLPSSLIPKDEELIQIGLSNMEFISFGVYYKTLKGNALLKDFIKIAKEVFSTVFE